MIVEDIKKSILQKAFEGKITLRKNADTKICETINIIKQQKKELVEFYKSKREPIYESPNDEECLFQIPDEWIWVRIGELGIFKKGPFGSALTKSIFVKKNENTIKVYEQQNAINKSIDLGNYYITKEYYESKMKAFSVKAGDILVSCAGTIGETYVMPEKFEKGIINQALMKMTLVKEVNKKYFLLYFDYILKKISNNLSSGSAIKNIPPFEVFKQLLIPLPSIEEQERIVNKIENLFDKLEDIKSIEENLIKLKSNFPDEIKKALMKAAMSGKLTHQIENESVDKIVKELNITNKVTEVLDGPFVIPSNWIWIKFGELVKFNIGKTPPRSNLEFWNGSYHWVSISDMPENDYISDTKEYISDLAFESIFKKKISKKGTLLMSFKLTVGRCSILDIDAFHNEGIISVYPNIDSETLKMYLFKILPYITKYGNTKGAIKGNTLNSKSLNDLLIPIPPLEEQKRIIDKLDKLLPICNEVQAFIN